MASRIALIATIIFVGIACYFGFVTKTKITGLYANIDELNGKLTQTTAQLKQTKDELAKTKDELAKTKDELQTTQAQLATTQSNLDAANAKVTDLTTQVSTLNDKIKALSGNAPVQTTAAIYTQADMDAVKKQLADAQAQVQELTQIKETLTNKLKDAESRADDLQKVVDHYKNNILKNGLEGQVLAVNQGWNFVVLSIGDRQGAVVNGEMIVKRNGSQIGKVKITSVDPSTSVADVVPGSLARGVRIQPGDTVIYQSNEQ